MTTFLELVHQTETVMSESAVLSEKLGFKIGAEHIREQMKLFQRKTFMVVVAGEVKRGKSSLLNAMLNESVPLFPVDMNVCTNVVTVVRYGKTEKIEVHIEDPRSANGVRIEAISREQIPEFVSESGNPGNFKNVKFIYAAVPNELLKEGVVFVDTPGVGSRNIEHAEATYSFLPNADVLLFVSDTVSGMTESELNFLKRGYRYCKNILFPLTKKDMNANYMEILSDNQEKIGAALNLPAEEIQIIPVSSMAKLRYLKTGSKTMYDNSNYAAFEEAIWTMIARQRGNILLKPFLMASKSQLLNLMENVAAQYQLLDADQNVVQELLDELQEKTEALETLQEKGADWRSQLNLFFTQLQNDISGEQRRMGECARTLLDQRAKNMDTKICREENYTRIVCEINDLIGQGIIDIREEMKWKIEDKMDELYRQMDIGICVNGEMLDRIGYTPQEQLKVVFPPKKAMDTAIKWGRNVTMNSMGGGTFGSLLGGLVGLCFGGPAGALLGVELGASVGGLAGGAKGCVDSLTKYDQLDVSTVMKELSRHIAVSMSDINTIISNTAAELRISLTGSFEQQLKKQTKELRENTAQLQKNIHLAADDIPKKQEALELADAQLQKQIGKYDSLEAVIDQISLTSHPQAPKKKCVPENRIPIKREEKKQEEPRTESTVPYNFL